MRLAGFIAAHYGLLLIYVLVAYIFGRKMTRAIRYGSHLERFLLSTALGFGVVALVVFTLGTLRLLYPFVFIGALLLGLLLCSRTVVEIVGELRTAVHGFSFRHVLIVLGIAAAVSPFVLLPLYPPTGWDSTWYHLPYAKAYVSNHALIYALDLQYPVSPQIADMGFTGMLLVADDLLAQLTQFMAFLLVCGLSYVWASRAFGTRAGVFAAVLTFASPLLVWVSWVALIDATFTLFSVCAAYAWWRWRETDQSGWIVVAGAFAGLAAGTRYQGLIWVALLGLTLLYSSVRTRRVAPLIWFGLAAVAGFGPIYLRNLYYTGNPVWPALGQVFGLGPWSVTDAQAYFSDLQTWGVPKTLLFLVKLPWYLVVHYFPRFGYDPLPIFTHLHLGMLILVPLTWSNPAARRLYVLTVPFVLFWFFSYQVTRYLLPVVPMVNVLIAFALDRYLTVLLPGRKRMWEMGATAVVCALLFSAGGVVAYRAYVRAGVLLPIAKYLHEPVSSWPYVRVGMLPPTTETERDQFLSRQRPGVYDAVAWLNRNVKQYTVYQLFTDDMTYFFSDRVIGQGNGYARFGDVIDAAYSAPALHDKLKALGATHLLVTFDRYQAELPADLPLQTGFKLLFASGTAELYELTDDHPQVVVGPELINNGSFESVEEGRPVSWEMEHKPRIAQDGGARTGAAGVQVDFENAFFQTLPVDHPNVLSLDTGKFYRLSYYVRADVEGQLAQMQVYWLDGDHKLVLVSMKPQKVGNEWKLREMFFEPPANASYGVIYVRGREGSQVIVDDASLVEVQYK